MESIQQDHSRCRQAIQAGPERGGKQRILTDMAKTAAIFLAAGALMAGPAQADNLVNGGAVVGSIAPAHDVDVHTFVGTTGESVQLRVADVDEGDLLPLMKLKAPDGTELTSAQGSLVGGIEFGPLPADGTYSVEISDNSTGQDATGTYAVYFTLAPGANEGGALPNGDKVAGSIDLGDLDSFTFAANMGETVMLRAADSAVTAFFPRMTLYAPDGSVLQTAQGAGVASIELDDLAATGTYTVVLADNSTGQDAVGAYDLHYIRVPGANEGGTLPNGGMVSGDIGLGDLDSYTFVGAVGDSVQIRAADNPSSSFFPRLTLYAPDGSIVSTVQRTSVAALEVEGLTAAGTYTVVLADNSNGQDAAGFYDLHFALVPGASEGGSLNYLTRVDGVIDVGDIDSYTFDAEAGEGISISVEDTAVSSFLPRATLYAPDGSVVVVAQGALEALINIASLPADGTYTLLIADNSTGQDATGDYTLTADVDNGDVCPGDSCGLKGWRLEIYKP